MFWRQKERRETPSDFNLNNKHHRTSHLNNNDMNNNYVPGMQHQQQQRQHARYVTTTAAIPAVCEVIYAAATTPPPPPPPTPTPPPTWHQQQQTYEVTHPLHHRRRLFSGPIPHELSKLEELEQLFLGDNNLEGTRLRRRPSSAPRLHFLIFAPVLYTPVDQNVPLI